ncbi:MAG: ABC transporter ATP-binding protein [Lachnospiraceae bacterium]|nr:ABC transporter ATP-binding protein [Lachnospiraceae bacterium]
MIELKNVSKIYKNGNECTKAADEINLVINEGEFIAIMGSSGSGKSTLLNIIGCMDEITSGEYFLNNIPIHGKKMQKLHKIRRENISFVFQNFALMNHYSVYENVEIPLIAQNIKKKERKRIIEEKLKLLGIDELKGKLPTQISGGQQQRCAIARALAADNNIILADEPTGALDKRTGLEIMDILISINRTQKKTVIIVTHDEKIAEKADRIIRIEDGRIYRK